MKQPFRVARLILVKQAWIETFWLIFKYGMYIDGRVFRRRISSQTEIPARCAAKSRDYTARSF